MEGPLEASKQTSTEGPIQVNSVNHKHCHALLVILGIIILAGLSGSAFALPHSSQQPKKQLRQLQHRRNLPKQLRLQVVA